MGFSLSSNNGKHFSTNRRTYHSLLQLAYSFGWKPMGTVDSEITKMRMENCTTEELDWGYFDNGGQMVTSDDAKEIAKALHKSLQYIPDTDYVLTNNPMRSSKKIKDGGDISQEVISLVEETNQITEFSKDPLIKVFAGGKDFVKEFIEFCEDGAFIIL